MKILIGTNNKNKLKQFRRIFTKIMPEMETLSIEEAGITDDVEEDADNLMDNAKKKAKHYAEKSGMLTMADDTGLFVDALGGEPGIHAKRWHGGSEIDRCEKLLERLKEIPEEKELAVTPGFWLFLIRKKKNFWTYQNDIEGIIVDEFKGTNGFGYDPIFKTIAYGKNYAELSDEEIDKINHRGMGIVEFAKFIQKNRG